MESNEKTEKEPTRSGKKRYFFVGVIIGIMIGMVATMVIINLIEYNKPNIEDTFLEPQSVKSRVDTVIQHIVYAKQTDPEDEFDDFSYSESDTAFSDSLMIDETQNLMLDDAELQEVSNEQTDNMVASDKLLSRKSIDILYLSADKKEIAAPDNAVTTFQIEQWNTPIKNKLSYFFNGNTLKIKGLNIDRLKIYHYNHHYYLINGMRIYPIHENQQFERLSETHDLVFE